MPNHSMDEPKKASRWALEVFGAPLAVGLLVAISSYLLATFNESKLELTYTIDAPIRYLDNAATGSLKIEVEGAAVQRLIAYRVRIQNTGTAPLADLGVRVDFGEVSPDFKVFNVSHATVPEQEFGRITEDQSGPAHKRIVYGLLNPDDLDVITFIVNDEANLSVFAKSSGMTVKQAAAKEDLLDLVNKLNTVFSVAASLLSVVLVMALQATRMYRKAVRPTDPELSGGDYTYKG